MADPTKNIAASVKDRLLNMARKEGRSFDILLVRFALERLLFRLSKSPHRDNPERRDAGHPMARS
jgi:hypothetical protein